MALFLVWQRNGFQMLHIYSAFCAGKELLGASCWRVCSRMLKSYYEAQNVAELIHVTNIAPF